MTLESGEWGGNIPTFNANQNHSEIAHHPHRTAGVRVITTSASGDVEKLEPLCGCWGYKMQLPP